MKSEINGSVLAPLCCRDITFTLKTPSRTGLEHLKKA